MLAWPSISCTVRRSQPPSIRWVANEWRSVSGDLLGDPRGSRMFAHQLEDRLAGDALATVVQKEDVATLHPAEGRPAALEVNPRGLGGTLAHRHDALLGALAHAAHHALAQVDVGDAQRHELGDPQSRAVEQLEHRPVAQSARAAIRAGDDRLGLRLVSGSGSRRPSRGSGTVRPASARAPSRARCFRNARTAASRRRTVAGERPRSAARRRSRRAPRPAAYRGRRAR